MKPLFSMRSLLISTIAIASLSASIFMSGCKDEGPDEELMGAFELALVPKAGGATFQNGLIHENILGQSYTPLEFKMFISRITLIKENGEEILLSDVELFDLGNGGQANKTAHSEGAFALYEDVPVGNYRGIKFGLGVHPDLNATQPADYTQGEPLANTSMYWSWATGYRHIILEGRVDEDNSGQFNTSFAYHTGLDALYREKEYTEAAHAFSIANQEELQFIIEIDVNRMFYNANDTINMVTEAITHTTPEGSDAYKLAEKIADNLADEAMFKVPF